MKKILITFIIVLSILIVALVVLNIGDSSFTLPNAQTNEYPDDYPMTAPVEDTVNIDAPKMEVHHDHPEITQ